MSAILPIKRFLIIGHINSAKQNIFGFKKSHITATDSELNLALMNIKHPLFMMLSVVILFGTMGIFISYEFTRLFNLGPLSFQALEKIEIILFVLFAISFVSLRRTQLKAQKAKGAAQKNPQNPIKVLRNRLILVLIMSVMFFTY